MAIVCIFLLNTCNENMAIACIFKLLLNTCNANLIDIKQHYPENS